MQLRPEWSFCPAGLPCILGAVLGLALAPVRAAEPIRVVLPEVRQGGHAFEGWGTSLCWWAHGAGRWNDAALDKLVGHLVDPDTGLGYTLFRYNIGGGDAPGHAHMRKFGDIPGYKVSENAAYDWTADPHQRKVVQKLRQRRDSLTFEAFSNSPPWWMTRSGCTGGNTDGSDNLKPESFAAFAEYLSEVVDHFRSAWGVTFASVTPFNEPSARWWTGPNKNQEGCGFRDNQARMIRLLGHALKNKGLTSTRISAPEENSIAEALVSVGQYDDTALSFVGRINTHSYNGKESRRAFADMAAKLGKPTWQSESGPLVWPGGNQNDVSLWMADVIIRDIGQMRVNGWLDWQALDAGNWTSFQVDDTRQTATPVKRFFMHAQFSRFIRPGSWILPIDYEHGLAALVPSRGPSGMDLVVVLLNPDAADITVELAWSQATPFTAPAEAYRTSDGENLMRLPDVLPRDGRVTFTVKARSTNTLRWRDIVKTVNLVPRMRRNRVENLLSLRRRETPSAVTVDAAWVIGRRLKGF